MNSASDLPDDINALKAIILAQQEQAAVHTGVIARKEDRIVRLEKLVADFKRALVGAKSEKVCPEQFKLALEDIETAQEAIHAEDEEDDRQVRGKARPCKANRGFLPKHLPRVEEVIEPESTTCDCGCERHVIGEEVSERLDIVPAQFRVIVIRRPKYACRSCEVGITQAPAPAHLIAGGMPTETTVAHAIVSKYADHLPLYRQAQIYRRQGIDLDRSTLAAWVGRAAFELSPVYDALLAGLKRSNKLFMDETTAAVLDPGRRKTKTGYFGRSPVMTDHGAAKILQVWLLPTRPDAPANMPRISCRAFPASCKWMAMRVTTGCSNGPLKIFSLPTAGPMQGVNCMRSPNPAQHRLPTKG